MAAPHSVFIVLTTDCDSPANCPWCFYNTEPERRVQSKLGKDDIIVFLKKMRLMNSRDVYLTGGEPLMRDDLEEIIHRAGGMDLRTFLISNGRMLTKERAGRIDRCGLDIFCHSINGLEQEDRKVLNRVRKLSRPSLSFIYVVHAQNFKTVPEAINMARDLNSGIIFQPAYIPEGHPLRESHSLAGLDPFDWSELHTYLKLWANELGFRDYLDLFYDLYHKQELRPQWCGMGRQAFVLDADGEVYPCFHRRDLKCGNILRTDVAIILDNLSKHAAETSKAPCYGEHCISLHTNYVK